MILLDTHIWLWWVTQSSRLSARQQQIIDEHRGAGLAVSVISCWEIAKKRQLGKLDLDRPTDEWLNAALQYPGVQLIALTPAIIVESTHLPAAFRSDPADEIICANARILGCPLLTGDSRLLAYPHVETLK